MKHSQLAALLLTGGLLAGCSDTLQSPDEMKTNEYIKHFIMDFGVPAEGHDFSMATTAGLKIKTSRAERIIVSAEIDGNEYEFANLTVQPGINPLPVTIPSTVSTLNIYVGFDKYSVGANETFDLDNPGSPVRSRDGYTWNSTDRTFATNTDSNPVIAFKYGDFLKHYFDKYPEGVDNTAMTLSSKSNGAWTYYSLYQNYGNALDYNNKKAKFFYCETAFGDVINSTDDDDYITFDLFPVYWRTSDDGKNYGFQFTDGVNPNVHQSINFGSTRADIPFPKLGYSSTVKSVNDINFSTFDGFTFDNGSFDKAFPKDNADLMIVSEGITVTVPKNQTVAIFNLDVLTYLNGSTTEYTMSSSGPYINNRYWGDNYFRTTLNDLVTCAGSTKRTMLDKYLLEDVKYETNPKPKVTDRQYTFNIYNPGDQTLESRTKGVLPFLLGFNTPAKSPDDTETVRDYANVIFLVVPRSKTSVLGRVSTKPLLKYYWTIAAEDFGGSFDWDFNDAVFSFSEVIEDLNTNNSNAERTLLWGPNDAVPIRSINVWANAAGGTMPLYITYTGKVYSTSQISIPSGGGKEIYSVKNEEIRTKLENAEVLDGTWIIGTEIHRWLARSSATEIYNTGEKREVITDTADKTTPEHKALSPVQIVVPMDASPYQYYVLNKNQSTSMSGDNVPLLGFGILVDKNDELQIASVTTNNNAYTFAPLPEYKLGEGCYFIGKPDNSKGNIAPQMILIPGGTCGTTSNISSAQQSEWEWPRENVSIKDAYPDFLQWVMTPNFDWTKNVDKEKVTQK